MNDEAAHHGRPATTPTPPSRIQQNAARVTGLQAAQLGTVRQLEGWRDQLGPREYTVLVALIGRWIDDERERLKFQLRRWAA